MATSQRTRRQTPKPADTPAVTPQPAGAAAAVTPASPPAPPATPAAAAPRSRTRKPKAAVPAVTTSLPVADAPTAQAVDAVAPAAVASPAQDRASPRSATKPAKKRVGGKAAAPAVAEAPAMAAVPVAAPVSVAAPVPISAAAPAVAALPPKSVKSAKSTPAPTAARRAPSGKKPTPKPTVAAAPRPPARRPATEVAEAAPTASTAPVDDTVQAVLAVLAAGPIASLDAVPAPTPAVAPVAEPTPAAVPEAAPVAASPPAPAAEARPRQPRTPAPSAAPIDAAPPTGPAHSEIVLVDGDQRHVAWRAGHACPPALRQAAQQRLDATGHLAPDDDAALPTLLRLAAEAHHPLRVDEAVWAHLAVHRDARTRLHTLEAAYPGGPANPAFAQLLRSPLPLFQAEGALFAVVAGRALIADERGLGKGVQAIAAAQLWRRHFGVQRVLVLCAADQRAAWRRAWTRFAGEADVAAPQLMAGGLHQRQALWSTSAGVRILSPEALDSDAAHLAQWAPDLVIVDEPQHLGLRAPAWSALDAPHALVLCGAALAEQPALMEAIVAWLDTQRLGPLAALHELQAASDTGRGLDDADIERLTNQLSRLMLQRLRDDVQDQLPPLVHTERLLAMAPGQREAHDRHLGQARRLVDGWQRSAYLSDADQWSLSVALREMQRAAHRADPADPASGLADATVQALAAQLADWADTGAPRVAVLCPDEADLAPLAQRLAERGALATTDEAGQPLVHLVAPSAAMPAAVDVVLQVGVPWRPRRSPAGARDEALAGQQWVYLVAQDSLDTGLFDTLAQRHDAPRGLADGGGRAYLQGERLAEWMRAVQAALAATVAGR